MAQRPRHFQSARDPADELDGVLDALVRRSQAMLQPASLPPPTPLAEDVFAACEALARKAVGAPATAPAAPKPHWTRVVSFLLPVDKFPVPYDPPAEAAADPIMSTPARQKLMEALAGLTHELFAHPAIFLTPRILQLYVSTRALLNRPETIPTAFHLYAHKAMLVPGKGGAPPRYRDAKPHAASVAVPKPVADMALNAAFRRKDLTLALETIDESYGRLAWRQAKFLRKGVLPLAAFCLSPLAGWQIAGWVVKQQTTMDPEYFRMTSFGGIMSYIIFTSMLGFIVLTTVSDQMDRVSWVAGVPLRERWYREEERAALDRVACTWGIRDRLKRGEEEGEDWAVLKEWVGFKKMVLDKVERMDGMK
ncbi:MAG: hypothetical protein M1826_005983 [Phylliscum demangeonii]|nr:MAG: hypothetical protein M1826_005983 [Phylliscum demangeonii]